MPLLNDAKTCYVGTTPITTIMAGSVQVWPKGPEALDLRTVKYSLSQGAYYSLGVEFQENNNCFDCFAMKATYQFRYTTTTNNIQSWTGWLEFKGSRNSGIAANAYCNVGSTNYDILQGELFELRAKGIVTGPLLLDIDKAPKITVYPSFSC